MKRKYEIVYIFDSALEEPEVNEHLERFHALLKSPDQEDPITSMAHWGKRTLAYPIKKKEVGYLFVWGCFGSRFGFGVGDCVFGSVF